MERIGRDEIGLTPRKESRRTFLKQTALSAAVLASTDLIGVAVPGTKVSEGERKAEPWFRRVLRWGQTNINELDPTRYDIEWWRGYWKRTGTQGVIVNAGGIVAYYPSKFPLHRRAQFLGDRDLFGDLTRAAHADGIAVLARMDSGGAGEEFHQAHSDWFAVDGRGRAYRSRDLYAPCLNGPYYREYLPEILREIAQRYHPEGFTDNSWSGLGRNSICYCENCARKFRDRTGKDLPRSSNWDDAVYRDWVQWSYACRLEIWDLNNRTTRDAGGRECLWVGMNSGSVSGQCQSFRDYKEICARSEIVLLDHQSRSDSSGFQNNGECGKLIHGLLGWDKLIPESMAMYQSGRPTFRFSAKPAAEARMWMLEGFAGGIQPWWHHLGAVQEDRRAFNTVEPVNRWHRAHEQYLVNRRPVATIGVVWSQQNTDFYGRDEADLLVDQPWRGITQALVRARIPYLPVHADQLERDAKNFAALILPNLASLTESQIAAVRAFVQRGGGLLATGESSLCNQWGEPWNDFALADLFGVHAMEAKAATNDSLRRRWASETQHSYLRLEPGSRAGEKRKRYSAAERHAVLKGFEETDLLAFGGGLPKLRADADAKVLLTFVPPFPVYPPESVWMREPRTDTPGLVIAERKGQGRVAYLPADLDRRFARENLPDHGDLLANLIRWSTHDEIPLKVEGPGLIDCHLYAQPGRMILHLVNLTSAGTWRAPVSELIPVGPLRIEVKLPVDVSGKSAQLLAAEGTRALKVRNGRAEFELKSVIDHEVVVIS